MTEEKLIELNEMQDKIITKQIQLQKIKEIKSNGELVIELHNLSEHQQAVIADDSDFINQIKQMAIEKLEVEIITLKAEFGNL